MFWFEGCAPYVIGLIIILGVSIGIAHGVTVLFATALWTGALSGAIFFVVMAVILLHTEASPDI